MSRWSEGLLLRMRLTARKGALAALILIGVAVPASGQGIKRVLVSGARVFPEFGPGVAAMKSDGAGRYFVLATPANVIWIVGEHGKRLGQIPKAGAAGATIKYAVDLDIDPTGRILVADRGANAIEIFQADGTFVGKVQVFAPTSVVALSDGEFAVSTLRTKRLVVILNDKGDQIRTFGDPADAGVDVTSTPLESLGRISGDSTGHIYYAFTTLAKPTVRKFDRFGYAQGDASVTNEQLSYTPQGRDDRVQFGFNVSRLDFSSMIDGGAMIGTSGDIQINGGVGTGLGGRIGGQHGPSTSAGLIQTLLSPGVGGAPGAGSGGGFGRGGGGGGTVTGQASFGSGDANYNFGLGSRRGGASGSGASGSGGDSDGSYGYKLQFNASDALNTSSTGDSDWIDAAVQDFQNAQALDQANGFGLGPNAGGGGGTNGLGQGVLVGLGGVGGGFGRGPVGNALPVTTGAAANSNADRFGRFGGGPGGFGGGYGGGFGGGFGRGRYPDTTNLTATVKFNLDPQIFTADEKPVITAVGVDPQTQDIWAAIGKALLHFDKNGNLLDGYLIATPEGAPLRAKAIVVEASRLIIASDPRGVFEFERPDKQAPLATGQQ